MTIEGKWRIAEMELWDDEAIDLVGPAFMAFSGQTGHFCFIAVEGDMRCTHAERKGRPYVKFTWSGNDECDPAGGKGWAQLETDGCLTGRIYFHGADDSAFRAVPMRLTEETAKRPAT
jgi:hypothetical protein